MTDGLDLADGKFESDGMLDGLDEGIDVGRYDGLLDTVMILIDPGKITA